MNRSTIFAIVVLAVTCPVFSQETGTGLGIEFGAGIAGSMSYVEVGVVLPKINDKVSIDVKARAMSAITWVTFRNMDTGDIVSFHPVTVGGVLSTGTVGPIINDELRVYGGSDLFFGYSFTPYDSAFYDTENLIPPNLTFAVWGYFGFEYFTSERSSIFIQSGGGFKSLLVEDKTNPYAVASSWLGSGFGIQMGSTIYLQ